ncbi:MAG: glucosamine-6-phosphate deaminase [Planctomycetes bacterium]|nr:glucosamine-6-phosphate deaminase [Planctomycetota bacterium]
MECRVFGTRTQAERELAVEVAELVRVRPDAVLGLATGNTPTGLYRELARMHRDEGLDFASVRTFNLDEYCGLTPDHPRAFRRWMREHFFDPAGIPAANTGFPDVGENVGAPGASDRIDPCADFERAIRDAGGIDLLVLGIGRNGHVAFNEPGSERASRTRRVELHPWTRADAAAAFGGLDRVPTHAITMGIATILEARRLRVLAFGPEKRALVARTLAATADPDWPASQLHGHPDLRLLVDRSAAG